MTEAGLFFLLLNVALVYFPFKQKIFWKEKLQMYVYLFALWQQPGSL